MDKDGFMQSGLIEQYVLGLTTEEESNEVEHYADAFPEVRAEINSLRKAVRQYAEDQIAAEKISTKPLASGAAAPPGNKRRPLLSRPWFKGNALLLLALVSLFFFRNAKNAQQEMAMLRSDHQAFKAICEKGKQDLHELRDQLSFIQHQRTLPLQLAGTTLAPESKIRVYWNEQLGLALLQVFFLPAAPETKQYQVWADSSGNMVDLGLIQTKIKAPQSIRCLPKASAINITLEPAGGSKAPHLDQVFANSSLPSSAW